MAEKTKGQLEIEISNITDFLRKLNEKFNPDSIRRRIDFLKQQYEERYHKDPPKYIDVEMMQQRIREKREKHEFLSNVIANLKKKANQIAVKMDEQQKQQKNQQDISLEKLEWAQVYRQYVDSILSKVKSDNSIPISPRPLNKSTSISGIAQKVAEVCQKIYRKNNMCPTKPQMYSILKLADSILNGTDKGSIGQIRTGEGKSFIIAILAIVLALYGRKVDVITSTIELAFRDQSEQAMYYNLFGIKSGVLYNIKNDPGCPASKNIKYENDFNVDVFSQPIVYSTNYNYEFVYLYSLFRYKTLREREYDVVIVDEVDNMLLDQASSPAIISRESKVANASELFATVYFVREMDTPEIISVLEQMFPLYEFNENDIDMLRKAAVISDNLVKDIDYIVKDGKVIIYDKSTGYIKPGSRWKNYLHEMIELREGLSMRNPSVSICAVTQKIFFNMYKKITGVTGTIGTESDIQILEKAYGISTFFVPRNLKSQQEVTCTYKSNNKEELFKKVHDEIELFSPRPVLVIFESKKQVDEFCLKYIPNANVIKGIDPNNDRNSIKNAGKPEAITIATNAAGRGVNIKLSQYALEVGGLHVIIPFLPENKRILDQAIGRSARNGEPGSANIYIANGDHFYKTRDFDDGYENLFRLQNKFDSYLREKYPFLFKRSKEAGIDFITHRFKASPAEILKTTSYYVSKKFTEEELGENDAADILNDMIMHAWGTFFTDLTEKQYLMADKDKCSSLYEEFLDILDRWVQPFVSVDANGTICVCKLIKKQKESKEMLPIEAVSTSILNGIGKIINKIIPEEIRENIFNNKMVSGIFDLAGAFEGANTAIMLFSAMAAASNPISALGLGILSAASAAFAIRDGIVGGQKMFNSIYGNDVEPFDLLKEVTGHTVDETLDLASLIVDPLANHAIGKVNAKTLAKTKPPKNKRVPGCPAEGRVKLTLEEASHIYGGLPIPGAPPIDTTPYVGLMPDIQGAKNAFDKAAKVNTFIQLGDDEEEDIYTVIAH